MNSFLTLALLCLLAVGQVFTQFNPSAGASSLVGSITGGVSNTVPDPIRWIEFMDMSNDWSKLGNTFTVEAWILQSTSGAATWQPVLARHPGQNAPRQDAHFIIATTNSAQVEVTAGCGCDSNGANCGRGFYLVGAFTPSVWHHVAVSFNGDNSTTAMADLYIDGVHVDHTTWSATDSQCLHRGSQWSEYANVHVGFLDDATVSPSSEANPNAYLGWWGRIDEIRFWTEVRTSTEIQNYKNVGLLGHEPNLFAYYQFSPSLEQLGDSQATQYITNKVGDYLHGLPQPNPRDASIFAQSSSLQINSYSMAEGQTPVVDKVPTLPNTILFESWPQSNTTTYHVGSGGISNGLNAILSMPNTTSRLEFAPDGKSATLYVECPANDCSSYYNDWLSYYIDFTATVNGVTTATTSRQYVQIMTACPSGNYDACGVCDGDNSQCQCEVYHGFESQRMSFVLLEWSLANLMTEITTSIQLLNNIESKIQNANVDQTRQEISDLMTFYNDELTPFSGDIAEFTAELESSTPKASLTAIDQSASPAADGTLPFVPSFNIHF